MSGRSYGAIRVTPEAAPPPDVPNPEPKAPSPAAPAPPAPVSTPPPPRGHVTKSVQTDHPIATDSRLHAHVAALRGAWRTMTFAGVAPLLARGRALGKLEGGDLDALPLPEDCGTEAVYERFERCWEEELAKARGEAGGPTKGGPGEEGEDPHDEGRPLLSPAATTTPPSSPPYRPSLVRALWRAFGADFLRAGLLKLVHDLNLFVGPQVLNRLIGFLRNGDAELKEGLWLAGVVTLSQIVMSVSLRHYFYKCYVSGLRIRTTVVVAVYRKSLLLSLRARHAGGGPGRVTNLAGVDAQRLQDLMTYLHAVWYSFLQIGLALYFLWGQVGPSCLAGVCVILCLFPTTKFMSAWMMRIQKVLVAARDERVALNGEILAAMKIIKIQAWEESFRAKLARLRGAELARLRTYFLAQVASITVYSGAPLLVALATFAAYTVAGHRLDVAAALTALALFEILRFPLFMLPQIINRIVEAGISLERVREFLLCEEYRKVGEGELTETGEVMMRNGTFVYDSKKPRLEEDAPQQGRRKGGIGALTRKHNRLMQEAALDQQWEMTLLRAQLRDAEDAIRALGPGDDEDAREEGEWPAPSSLLSLRRVSLNCKPGELVAVVGAVGSGKSTLINSILGEGRPLAGSELGVKGRLGAFLQNPFIMNDTVKNNILFGHTPAAATGGGDGPIDEARYQLALRVCSLSHDLELLTHGDQTEIGEKGITLSGGQKARVALARAVYHDADVYLLDDPLAAVDAHVGKDLFNDCIIDELLLGKSKEGQKQGDGAALDGDSGNRGTAQPRRNATVIFVTNALQHLSHSMVDRILVLDNGCVEESGTFKELSSDPKSRFASFLKTMADTSTAGIDQAPSDAEGAEDGDDGDDASLDSRSDGPESTELKRRLSRRMSSKRKLSRGMSSGVSAKEEGDKGGALMTDEAKERGTGSVSRQVYLDVARAGGGTAVAVTVLSLFAAGEAFNVASKWWLTFWSQNSGAGAARGPFFYLGIYGLINVIAIAATSCRIALFCLAGLRASRSMFERLLDTVLRAPMSFFDTTPTGRIINRFSKDMYTLDEQLIQSTRSYLATIVACISTIMVVTAVTPLFVLALFPIFAFYLHKWRFFATTYRELKRLDSITRSPIYALQGETLDGVLTIRAFDAEETLNNRMVAMVDTQQTAYFLTFTTQCWLAIRLEFAGAMIVMCACLVAVWGHKAKGGDEHFAGLAGLSISYALSITQSLAWTVRMASDVEGNMVAVERIQQYSEIPGEAPRALPSDESLPSDWPSEGRIDFKDVKLQYRPNLPLVLKGLNINIPMRSKVGVVGRTGAGKSTLMVALLRLVELSSGSITIDDVDIKKVGLKKLRSVIAVIPQDPVLFSGTIRSNLDPFDEYEDSRLFEVLQHVGLYAPMKKVSSEITLSSLRSQDSEKRAGGRAQPIKSLTGEVSEGGTNFSVGERQLIVIARAMLTGASIVIMDEATASVDADTDARIQRVFRAEFKDATCITVAHRLNTIMDSDLVLVMDNGKAAEFDKPSSLLSKEDGIFKSLVDAWEEEN